MTSQKIRGAGTAPLSLPAGAMPDIVDFPVSWDWYRHYCQYYSWPDPGPEAPETNDKVEELEIRVLEVELEQSQRVGYRQMKELRSEMSYIRRKLEERVITRRKNKGEY